MSINQRVKQVRQALNMSQAKFAKALYMSNGYIAGIELEHNSVNDRIIKLICFTFNVNENWLRTGKGTIFEQKPDQLTELAFATFKELKPEYQEYILKQIDQLLVIQNKEEYTNYVSEAPKTPEELESRFPPIKKSDETKTG